MFSGAGDESFDVFEVFHFHLYLDVFLFPKHFQAARGRQWLITCFDMCEERKINENQNNERKRNLK
jgi:hypothetical protein